MCVCNPNIKTPYCGRKGCDWPSYSDHLQVLAHNSDAKTPDIDNINHPPHYTNSSAVCPCGRTIECIDVVRVLPFGVANVIKYLWRYESKNGLEDLKKAVWYLKDWIKHLEGKKSESST